MHVILKPIIKILLMIVVIKGIAKIADVDIDVDSLLNGAKEKLDEFTSQQDEAQ